MDDYMRNAIYGKMAQPVRSINHVSAYPREITNRASKPNFQTDKAEKLAQTVRTIPYSDRVYCSGISKASLVICDLLEDHAELHEGLNLDNGKIVKWGEHRAKATA